MNLKLIAVVSISAGLVACGGGGDGGSPSSSTSSQTRSLQGVAIDGYISGATAFLDINYNGQLDSGEPSAVTNSEGSYRLSLSGSNSDCIDYAPIVVNVPVGAIDADHPNTPISEPYQLVFPPAMTLSSEHEIKSTTPLTTVLWNQIQEDLNESGITSCTGLRSAVNTQEKVIQNVKEHDHRIAARYNIAVDKIYGDFIKEQNKELYELAQKMMPAIRKSYSDTKALQQVNPGAHQAYVDYYWKYWDKDTQQKIDKWYKVKTVLTDTKLVHTEYEVSEDLQTEVLLTRHTERNTKKKAGFDYTKNASLWINEDNASYSCDITESIEQLVQPNSLKTYRVSNSSSTQELDWDSCKNNNVGSNFTQYLEVIVVNNYRDGMLRAQHTFSYYPDPKYPEWVNVEQKIDSFSRSTLDQLSYISSDFNDDSDYGAHTWVRSKHSQVAVTPFKFNGIAISRNAIGNWWKNTYYYNGTSSLECSPDKGKTWSKCK
ncbi:hypothetical protein L1D31_05530 [Vibrio sp. Isolate23]|uniref:hypothetical protein n=1 Tax=Vibrio sp. Isolate23 TaxID=2908533 RepID=UPI001EFD131A|nr:hypothetical protein [Vibrio sp. Isolate23]MCG9682025.1 hypothetical protein [Vibrio sp. Isolate23]